MRTLDFRLDIATKEAQKNVEKVNKDLEETQQLSEFELILKNADAVSSVKELNEAMEQLQNQALKFGEGSEEFVKAATKAGELKKRMDDVNRSIDTVASGGQLGQITTSFEGLRQSALTFDIEGITRNFALMKVQIAGAATSALGLSSGLSTAAVAARGLAVALAATGITLVIAAVALLVSEFENLADAGGLIGTIFTSIGNAMEFVREKALEVLDALGLIDLEAKKAQESQSNYLIQLQDDFEANKDAYDELTKSKKEAEIEYYKSLEDLNKRTDISEKRKNELIELYNKRRIRAVERAEKEAAEKLIDEKKKEELDEKKRQAEAEARQIGYIKSIKEKAGNELDVAIEEIRNKGLEGIRDIYDLEADRILTEQQQIERALDLRLEIKKREYALLKDALQKHLDGTAKLEENKVREIQKTILDIEIDLAGQRAAKIRAIDAEEQKKLLQQRASQLAEYNLEISERESEMVFSQYEKEEKIFLDYINRLILLDDERRQGAIINDAMLRELQLIAYEDYQNELTILSEKSEIERATFQQERLQAEYDNLDQEYVTFLDTQDKKLKLLNKNFEEEKITFEEYENEKQNILQETSDEQVRLLQEIHDKNLQITENEMELQRIAADNAIAEVKRVEEARIQSFNNFAGQVQNITGFIGDSVNAISDIQSMQHNKRLFEIEEEYTQQYNSLQAQLEAGLITEAQLANGISDIEEQRRKAKYKADKKAFEQEKAIRITQAVMTTIQASLAAYSSGAAIPIVGTVMGPVFAAIAAAFGAVQIGMIASEKFPSYQSQAAPSTNINVPSPTSPGSVGSGAGVQVPPAFYTNSGAVQGSDVMLNPGGIYQLPGSGSQQVWVLESDITGSQNQVQVTEDRSYFDAGAYGG